MQAELIELTRVGNVLNGQKVHRNVNLKIKTGDRVAMIGGSGSGKTTLLRNMLLLLPPTSGQVKIFNEDVYACSTKKANQVRSRFGTLFQSGALFGALTVLENIMFPLQEFTVLPAVYCQELAYLKMQMVGLPLDAAHKYPAELSGGMQKRTAAARAIVRDPEILFLDEPTSGLDPESTEAFDELILNLHEGLKLTLVFTSHDLSSVKRLAQQVVFIGNGTILAEGTYDEVRTNPHPLIRSYFHGYSSG